MQGSQWSTGLFQCFDEPKSCLVTFFCPCVTFGQIAEHVNKGGSCVTYAVIYTLLTAATIPCVYSCIIRKKMRAEYHLDEAPCGDFFVHCLCEMCSLCQEHRELRNHGWQGNMDKQGRGGAVLAPPVMDGGMLR